MQVKVDQMRANTKLSKECLTRILENVSTAIVILQADASHELRASIAEAIARSGIPLFAAWGCEAEAFHDEVDAASLRVREVGPITIWENDDSLSQFLWNVFYPYRGLLTIDEQDAGLLIICISDKTGPPDDLQRFLSDKVNRVSLF